MGDIRCRGIVLPAGGGFRWARRLTMPALWAIGLTCALLLLDLTAAPFAAQVKVVPRADVAAARLEVPSDVVAQEENRLTPCPLCGRLVCPFPCDDLLDTQDPDSAVLSANPAPCPVLGVLPLPRRYASSVLTPFSPKSFEPRGPPLSA